MFVNMNSRIDNVSGILQWPTMWFPLKKIIEWRNNGSPNIVTRFIASGASMGIALVTIAASITKIVFGIIFLIPPFTELGRTLLASTLFFESQVFSSSLKTALDSWESLKVKEFQLELV